MSKLTKKEARQRRHRRIRGKIGGTAECPRMSVFRSSKNIYVQFIDDEAGATLASISTLDGAFRETNKRVDTDGAAELGRIAAKRALAAEIKRVVFDRGGFKFTGRVKAVADAARESGLEF